MTQPIDFSHQFVPGRSKQTLLLLHGTGGNEHDLLPIGRELNPDAALLSPRGKILENGMPRFFRRLAEGVFDEKDVIRRAHELADFVTAAAVHYSFDPSTVIAVGYSNGANIAGAMLLLRPEVLSAAALLRSMVVLIPEPLPDLNGKRVFLASGNRDPIVPESNTRALLALLRRSGADVSFHSEEAGHGLTDETLRATQRWLAERTQ
jgi:predicted esterase